MIKVHILTTCEHCEGKAYLPIGDAESYTGDKYTRYWPCPQWQGSGRQSKLIDLQAVTDLLEKATAIGALLSGSRLPQSRHAIPG